MKMGRFCWNELLTRNPEAARRFYADVFGWQSEDHDMGAFVYTIFKEEGEMVGGMMRMPPDLPAEVPDHWFNYISVANVEEAVAALRKAGGQVKREPFAIGDFGRAAIVSDPSGAHFAFWQDVKKPDDWKLG